MENAFHKGGEEFLIPDEQKCRGDNLLACFDPDVNQWTKPETKGPTPHPRSEYGVACLGDRVFIYGGWGSDELGDMHTLDMEDMTWTEVKSKNGPGKLHDHTLSPISSSQLLKFVSSVILLGNSNFVLNSLTDLLL